MNGFHGSPWVGASYLFLASVTAVGLPVEAVAAGDSVEVVMINRASVSPDLLALAQHDVVEIYRDIGVDVVWTPTEVATVTVTATSRPLMIHIVTTAPPEVSTTAMGVAVRGDSVKDNGQLAYVFYDRVRQVGQRSRFPAVTAHILGAVMAHELGHLLLPFGHSVTGLMRGDWSAEELQGPRFDWLRFSRSQGDLIRRRLARLDAARAALLNP